jgi:hypothetical protein
MNGTDRMSFAQNAASASIAASTGISITAMTKESIEMSDQRNFDTIAVCRCDECSYRRDCGLTPRHSLAYLRELEAKVEDIAILESELQKAKERITVLENAVQSQHDYGTASPGEQEAAWILYCQATGWNPSEHPAAKNAFCEGFRYGDMFSQGDEGREVLRAELQKAREDITAAEDSNEALLVKLDALAPHGTCACDYDHKGDVCAHHSPKLMKALEQVQELQQWKDAITDAAVVNWTLSKENAEDPKRAINDLLCMAEQQALDPLISEPAAKLHQQIQGLRKALSNEKTMYAKLLQQLAKAALKLPRPWMAGSIEFDEWIEAMDKVLAALKKSEGR